MNLFKHWKRKKDTPKETFTLKNYKEQLFDYYKSNGWEIKTKDIDDIVYLSLIHI